MTTPISATPIPLKDALYALALAAPVPNASVLDDVVRRYPDYATELTEMAIELALDALDDEEDNELGSSASTAEVNEAVSIAMSRFQNRLYEVTAAERTSQMRIATELHNPFAPLKRAELRSLARSLDANAVFVVKLRDRLIEPATITDGFKKRVAHDLNVSFDVVAAHLAGHPVVAAQASYKADQKPEAGKKQSFEEAIRSSGLSAEQQAYLRSL